MSNEFKLICPVHKVGLMNVGIYRYRDQDSIVGTPLFYCRECNRYYVHYTNKYKKNIEIENLNFKKVIHTPNEYISTEKKVNLDKYKKAEIKHKADKHDFSVRLHRFKTEKDCRKLKLNLEQINSIYPELVGKDVKVNDFIKKMFPDKIRQKCRVRNLSYKNDKENLCCRVELEKIENQNISSVLEKNQSLVFEGTLKKGELVFDAIKIVENPVERSTDKIILLNFLYDGPNKNNCLYDYTKEPSKELEQVNKELYLWDEYLDWKQALAELRIKAIKYIGVRIDLEERKIIFLGVTRSPEEFNDFRKYLVRDEVSVFSNEYSKDKYVFDFNKENQNMNIDSGIPLTFLNLENNYTSYEIDNNLWSMAQNGCKKYSNEKDNITFEQNMREVRKKYGQTYFQEIAFELTPEANNFLDRQIKKYGFVNEDYSNKILKQFYSEGYIATSCVGDFSLIKRLKRAIDGLKSGRSVSTNLDQWIFDIEKARIPENIETINHWQNKNINELQKNAVEKILSCPDICLIQGPPGTGKTTVIAEAIYQLVVRNKRVLVSSQANLAVDNALERIISNPRIRAIRLGNSKKIDSSVDDITEENVLETFYHSLSDYINDEYLSLWQKADDEIALCEQNFDNYSKYLGDIKHIEQKIEEIDFKKYELKLEKDKCFGNIKDLTAERECLNSIKNLDVEALNADDMSNESLTFVLKHILDLLNSLAKKGLVFTKLNLKEILNDEFYENYNQVLYIILSNYERVKQLKNIVLKSTGSNLVSEKLEKLKADEKILMKKMQDTGDTNDFLQWREISKKIEEFEGSGGVIADYLDLFSGDTINEETIKITLKSCEKDLKKFENALEKSLDSLAEQIEDKKNSQLILIQTIDNGSEDLILEQGELHKEIKDLGANIDDIYEYFSADSYNISEKYKCRIAKLYEEKSKNVNRNTWEDIFKNLNNWIENIPDYTQEKDVFLKNYINGCNVVGVSCTENGRTLIENGFDDFDVVIIDEVSKATPPELLIPMLKGKKIVLVGDHRQLPPLFNEHEKTYLEVIEQQELSDETRELLTIENLNKFKDMVTSSLFQRYFENSDAKIKQTLLYQYRMHKDIMDITNMFYDGKLRDGNFIENKNFEKNHNLFINTLNMTPMIVPNKHAYWIDSSQVDDLPIYEQRKDGSTSAQNLLEAHIIIQLLKKMDLQYANKEKKNISVGVISFYYDQVVLIKKMLRKESFQSIDVEVNTVDRFQGKEKEIIFVSLVRNVRRSRHDVNSHIAAFQRINVAFSRAQNLLCIVGAKDMYVDQPVVISDMNTGEKKELMVYKKIVEMLNNRGAYFTADDVISETLAEEIINNVM